MSYTDQHGTRRHTAECERPHCRRTCKPPYTTCSSSCKELNYHWTEANNLHEALGASELTDAYLVSVRKLMALTDEVYRTRRQIRRMASEAGMDGDVWGALIRGTYGASQQAAG